jgi:sporulation protein YlmC with PRC-barrel domain
VLLLSRLIGQQVSTPDGRAVGRLADLIVRLDGVQLVERLLIRLPDRTLAPVAWDAVRQFHPGRVVVTAVPGGALSLSADEILLARDVLDTQIVDVVGQRLARVADVLLGRTRDGRLELCGVDVGFTGVLRRLGLRRVPASEDFVAWGDLHLTSERGHAVQLSTPRAAVHRLDARGLAALVSRVDVDAASEILASRDPQVAAEAVRAVHPEVAARIHRRSPLIGRRFFRSGVWPHRRRLIRGRHA